MNNHITVSRGTDGLQQPAVSRLGGALGQPLFPLLQRGRGPVFHCTLSHFESHLRISLTMLEVLRQFFIRMHSIRIRRGSQLGQYRQRGRIPPELFFRLRQVPHGRPH